MKSEYEDIVSDLASFTAETRENFSDISFAIAELQEQLIDINAILVMQQTGLTPKGINNITLSQVDRGSNWSFNYPKPEVKDD